MSWSIVSNAALRPNKNSTEIQSGARSKSLVISASAVSVLWWDLKHNRTINRYNLAFDWCNGCMPVRAVCKPHSPDLKRGALATDARGCSLWRSLLERPPPAPESRVRDPLGELGGLHWQPQCSHGPFSQDCNDTFNGHRHHKTSKGVFYVDIFMYAHL